MAPKYVLTYYNVRALAEPIRYLFAYGNIDYEDIRFEDDEWPEIKPTMPLGQVPVLDIDGKRTIQSMAITRYLAKQVGLVGANEWEDLQIDMVVETIVDLRLKIAAAFFDPNPQLKEEKLTQVKKMVIPFYLKKFDTWISDNNGYFVLGKLTWADILFAALYEFLNYMTGYDILENYVNLQSLVKKVTAIDGIKKWIENRPVTEE